MPDETDIIISELTNAPQIDDTAVFPLTQDNAGSPATFKASMSEIAGKVVEGTTFVNLVTTAKTPLGAINEIAQGGGGSADIISEASGVIATFSDGGDNIPVKSLVTDITATQAGTGTPSPSNPRAISGFDTVVITNKDDIDTPTVTDTHTTTLPETIYGGTAEIVGGNGTEIYALITLTGQETGANYAWNSYTFINALFDGSNNGARTILCSHTNNHITGLQMYQTRATSDYPNACCVSTGSNVRFRNNACTSLADYQTWLQQQAANGTPVQIVAKLATPTAFSFTPEQITTLSGVNNIYSNTGEVEIEYFNENADQTAELIDVKQEFANYSYEEKIVGKWVDGSDLYEKTLYFNNVKLDKTDSTSELVHGIDNIGSIRFVAEVYFKFPNSGQDSWSPANNGLWNNGVYNFYWCVGETSIFILSASGVYFDANPNRSYLVKIRYTKA